MYVIFRGFPSSKALHIGQRFYMFPRIKVCIQGEIPPHELQQLRPNTHHAIRSYSGGTGRMTGNLGHERSERALCTHEQRRKCIVVPRRYDHVVTGSRNQSAEIARVIKMRAAQSLHTPYPNVAVLVVALSLVAQWRL
jgi:hypothetical protein